MLQELRIVNFSSWPVELVMRQGTWDDMPERVSEAFLILPGDMSGSYVSISSIQLSTNTIMLSVGTRSGLLLTYMQMER